MMNNPLYNKIVKDPNMLKMAENLMKGSKGGAMPDMGAMGDLMKSPTMKNVMKNPDII